MLYETYNYAIENKEKILEPIKEISASKFYSLASSIWNKREPKESSIKIASIDSGWNYVNYHGYYLYAVNCVSVCSDSSFLVPPLYEVGLGTLETHEEEKIVYNPSLHLQSIGMEFEYVNALRSIAKCDVVLVDGSLLARYYDRRQRKRVDFYKYASELMNKRNVVFIAKNSESNLMLKGNVGDIYYFNKATNEPGFSEPYYDTVGITVFYARMCEYEPCLKVEVPGKLSKQECASIFDSISQESFSGYPYSLRLAHEMCKVSNDDMHKLASCLGLDVEISSREVLGE